MPLFASLYPLAQKATPTIFATAEGNRLRVNVTPGVALPMCLLGMSMPLQIMDDVVCKVPEPV